MSWPAQQSVLLAVPRLLLLLLMATALAAQPGEAAGSELEAAATAPDFWLHTRRNEEQPQRVAASVESLLRSPFYALEPIVLLLPRWQGNSTAREHALLVEAQLALSSCNVFAVDLSNSQEEEAIVSSVAQLIVLFHVNFDVPLAQLLLIGFDAGAHMAGAAAQRASQQLGQPLPHIIALDPAPTDSAAALQHTLSSLDAQLVEVLHTNGAAQGGLGTLQRLGHLDYYPNGGEQQPGCLEADCAHERALELVMEMWSAGNDFLLAECGALELLDASNCRWTLQRMGAVQLESVRTGIYFLGTQSSAPYSKGAYHMEFL